MHLTSKLELPANGGGRAAIVLSGSPLFNGGAASGESEIRRWLLENDLVETIYSFADRLVLPHQYRHLSLDTVQ